MANQLFKLLYGLYFVRTVPVMVWGNPGGGKTSAIMNLGEKLHVPCELRSANKCDPVDLSGLPFLDDVKTTSGKMKKITRYSTPSYVKHLKKSGNGILFFDEITTCPPAIQSALLTIFQECKFGEFEIPKTTFRIAAGNYNNVVGTNAMSMALLNRCIHIFVKPNVEQFCQGIVSDFSNYEYAIINSDQEQLSRKIQYSVMVSDFIRSNPQFLPEEMPEDLIEHTDVAYPTSRSWSNAIRILSVLDKNEDDYIKELLDGCIGLDASKAFRRYMHNTEKFIDLLEYVGKENKLVLPNPNRHDEVMHIMESIAALLKQDPKRYFRLYVRIVNLLHNKGKKFGDYTSYDTFIMKYIFKCFEELDRCSMLSKDTILSINGLTSKKDFMIDDFKKLYTLAYNGSKLK